MTVKVYDSAYLLEKSIRESEEFAALKKQYQALNEDAEANKLFQEFRDIQLMLQEKQMTNQPIDPEEVIRAQELVQVVQQNEKITALMEAEQRMSNVIMEINKIVMKPLEELYNEQMGK